MMEPFEKKGMEEKRLAHVVAAFRFSMGGLKVLMREEAARLELVLLAVAVVLFFISGASLAEYFVLAGLFLGLMCIEALNTAIELIVDKTSPERSDYAKQTKDLGSFAVFCGLTIFCIYALWTIIL